MPKKYKILNIRGCNGSGKSYLTRELMKECNIKPVFGEPEPNQLVGSIIGYKGDYRGEPIYFVGSYEIMAGGADAVMARFGTIEKVCELVRQFAPLGHVIFEGFIVSGLFSRFYNLSKELGGITFCYIDTPLETCLKRIEIRNQEKTAATGRVRKGAGNKTVAGKFKQVESTRRKFLDVGENVVMVNHKKPMKAIHKALQMEK